MTTSHKKISLAPSPRFPKAYRSAIAAADVVAIPGAVTCTKQAGGSATAGVYYTSVVAGNAHGRTTGKAGDVTITTETTNLTIRAAFAAVTGATFYDIYCSRSASAAAALWVGRITEAQRAAGCVITAVGVVGAGGVAGAVDIQVEGTGLQSGTTAAENTAYVLPTGVDCSGADYVDFDLAFARTGDTAALSATIIPFFYNARDLTYYLGDPKTLFFGGVSGALQSLKQRIRVEIRGNSAAGLIVAKIAGTGASLSIDVTLS